MKTHKFNKPEKLALRQARDAKERRISARKTRPQICRGLKYYGESEHDEIVVFQNRIAWKQYANL